MADLLEIIKTITILVAAVLSGMAAMYAAKAKLYAAAAELKTIATAVKVDKVEADVHKVELATNSMKDALVKATGDAAHLAGQASGREMQKLDDQEANIAADTKALVKAVEDVPEKTSSMTVEKLEDKLPSPHKPPT